MTEELQQDIQQEAQDFTIRDSLEQALTTANDNQAVDGDVVDDTALIPQDNNVELEPPIIDEQNYIPKEWNEQEQDALKHLIEVAPEQAKMLLENRYQ